MLQFPIWKTLLVIGACLAGLIFSAPNLFYETADEAGRARAQIEKIERAGGTPDAALLAAAEAWPSWLPPGVVRLGLDLRGGAHLLVEVQIAEVVGERLEGLRSEVREALREAGVRRFTGLAATPEEVRVTISQAEQVETAGAALRGLAQPVGGGIAGGFGMGGIAGGSDLEVTLSDDGATYHLRLTEAAVEAITDRTMAQSLEIMRRRIDESGTREPTIQRQGADRILIQVPGIGSAGEILDLIGRTAKLTFHDVEGFGEESYSPGPGQIVVEDAEGGAPYLLKRRSELTGENLTDASLGFHPETGLPVVNFRFDTRGARIFGDYTAANVGQLFAIVLDNQVISAPRIQSPILGGSGFIEGNFNVDSATSLSILLRSGALPASIKVLEQRTVGPDLGADSISAGSAATVLAFIAVLVFMMAAYGRFGTFAAVALVLNMAMLIGLLSIIGATLTLPGIAGIVLTIGMAVDANVLIFERIREELRSAKGPSRAIDRGYSEALSAIIDANITTLIAAVILFAIGSGPVKGFAVTLGLGIVTSVFTATMVTRLMVVRWLDWARPSALRVVLLKLVPEETRIGFMGMRKGPLVGSAAACIGAIALAAVMGMNFGIDFRGGTMIEIRTAQPADLAQIRETVSGMELGDVAVQSFGSERDVLVRIEEQAGDGDDRMAVAQEVEQVLVEALPGTEVRRVEVVGPKVSGELLQAGGLAILLAVLAVLVYIWLRFEWQFGLGAVVALLHDVVLTVGVFAVTQIEFNLAIIAAILTIVGYSLNDTVVVFDRVRENLRKYKKMPLIELLDLSINETLARTVMTSVTTLIALVAMFLLGPPVIQGFTFAMIWGVVIGTYSSVFIAAATLLWFGVNRDWSTAEENKAGIRLDGAQV
ncbi:protein translocase subunit SecDF [Paralimibaculum aggregatum]|uniref:Multifunctional fusion protein n=1 Tax=Paralimibaculum aggregatum TaxID=3036245 RepID=A0ABQ6LIJ4_9RHOB|nr:protein translocase subunit SecD [Limibaculum sp. NKW23]GMG82256.1 protein translocase subunit SecDF [Limibaculum sp. NKW23]